jgi:hypothetical protein
MLYFDCVENFVMNHISKKHITILKNKTIPCSLFVTQTANRVVELQHTHQDARQE